MAEIIYSPIETSKAHERRIREGFFEKYVKGMVLDIGAGHDPLGYAGELQPGDRVTALGITEAHRGRSGDFPMFGVGRLPYVVTVWDICHGDGDAHLLEGVKAESMDTIHSSHLLEHLEDPVAALRRWFEVLKPGGYLLLLVPHRDRYENRRLLPSRWNEDHKSFWLPEQHDPPHTWGLEQVLGHALPIALLNGGVQIEYIKVCDEGWYKPAEGVHAGGEYSIEAVVKKL